VWLRCSPAWRQKSLTFQESGASASSNWAMFIYVRRFLQTSCERTGHCLFFWQATRRNRAGNLSTPASATFPRQISGSAEVTNRPNWRTKAFPQRTWDSELACCPRTRRGRSVLKAAVGRSALQLPNSRVRASAQHGKVLRLRTSSR
jgi:hypothetical protein